LASIAVDGVKLATPSYNPDATLSSVAYGNGVSARFGYNDQLVLTGMEWTTANGSYSSTREVSAGGNQSSATLTAPSGSSTFTYVRDSNNRMSSASVTAGLVPFARTWAWTFDGASNRLSQKITDNGVVASDYNYAYNKASQLVSTNDPAASAGLSYDERGNATQVGSNSFVYDNMNNLTSATDGTVTVRYTRGVAGAVIAKSTEGGSGAGTIQYSPSGVLLDADARAYAIQIGLPGAVQLTKSLVGGSDAWMYTGLNGDAFFTTDSEGTLLGSTQVYDPYGNALVASPAPVPGLPSTTWQANTGNETESLRTPYQLMGARVYVPALGRFAQLDPKVGGSANGYDFVNQDPVNASDPTGNEGPSVWDWVTVGAAAVAGVIIGAKWGVKIGLVMGAVSGLVVTGAVTGIEYAVTGQTEFSLARVLGAVFIGAAFGGLGGMLRFARSISNSAPQAPVQRPVALTLVERYKSPPKVGLGENRVTMRAITEDVDDSFLSLSEGSRRSRRVLPEMQSSPTSNFAQNLGSHSDGALAKGVIGDGVGSPQPTYLRTNFLDDIPGANYD
jgi:RHS repeat-associated protein